MGVILSQVALSTPFDNATNGFVAYEVQSAIEEARNTALGKLRDPRHFAMNGTVSNGNWISVNNLIPSFKYVFTEPVKLIGIEWSCGNGNGKDFDLEFYKNGETVSDLFRIYEIRNSLNDYGYEIGWSNLFDIGDFMRVKYIDQGLNVSDFAGRFLFEVL